MLFTDIEGSTGLALALGAGWRDVLADHHAIVGGAIGRHGGFVDGIEGDSFFAAFADAGAAVAAAVAALRELRAHEWPPAVGDELRVRMGVHVGAVERTGTGYVGLEVHRAARVAAAAHGGQLLLTRSAVALAAGVVAVEPLGAHRLKGFPGAEQLFCAVIDGRGAAAFPPPRAAEVRLTNLPAATTALIGRAADLARVRAALTSEGARLVTLTGRGGAGKTTLARAVAEGLLDAHPGGVWWVALATLSAHDEVPGAIATATGAQHPSGGSAVEAVVERLRDRGPALLVLDNLEHLLAAAQDVAGLLEALPGLRVLATSQLPLGLPGERVLALDTLEEDAALALVHAAADWGGARLADDAALLEVVRLVDGLPLGLELAAARLRILTPAQLRDRLVESLGVLEDRGHGRLERHRSLIATLDWTLGLLGAGPRALFTRMGAFAGSVELEDLEAAAGGDDLDVVDALAGLVDAALIRRVASGDGRARFALPEALRQIAAARLDAAPDGARWRLAHAQRQLAIAWPARYVLTGTLSTVRRAMAATAEAEAALRWARATGHSLAAPLAAALGARILFLSRLRDVAAMIEPVLAEPHGDAAVLAVAAYARAGSLYATGQLAEAAAVASETLCLSGDGDAQLNSLLLLGVIELDKRRPAEAVRIHERATSAARGGHAAGLARALAFEAQARIAAGDLDSAGELLDECERVARQADATALATLPALRAALALERGRAAEALERYAYHLLDSEGRRDALDVMWDLVSAANALAALGRDHDALVVLGMSGAQAADAGAMPAPEHLTGNHRVLAAEQRLGPRAAEAAQTRGRAIELGQRVATVCRMAHITAPAG